MAQEVRGVVSHTKGKPVSVETITVPDPENYWTYFLGIENFRFRKMVLPGDTLVIQCDLLAPIKRGIAKMTGRAYVGNTLVCEGTMTASIVRKDA